MSKNWLLLLITIIFSDTAYGKEQSNLTKEQFENYCVLAGALAIASAVALKRMPGALSRRQLEKIANNRLTKMSRVGFAEVATKINENNFSVFRPIDEAMSEVVCLHLRLGNLNKNLFDLRTQKLIKKMSKDLAVKAKQLNNAGGKVHEFEEKYFREIISGTTS